jgi:hypothetical protein
MPPIRRRPLGKPKEVYLAPLKSALAGSRAGQLRGLFRGWYISVSGAAAASAEKLALGGGRVTSPSFFVSSYALFRPCSC